MNLRGPWVIVSAITLIVAILCLAFAGRFRGSGGAREDLLARVPARSEAVFFLDFVELRSQPFFAKLADLASSVNTELDYVQFVRETGFEYQRDLKTLVVARWTENTVTSTMASACGSFDAKKITDYLSAHGASSGNAGHQIFLLPPSQGRPRIAVAFLNQRCLGMTNNLDPAILLAKGGEGPEALDWQQHFVRLSGSPMFAVFRQESIRRNVLPAAPSQLRSPQLTQLLGQLRWITVAGKPEGNAVRVVAECESNDPRVATQLGEIFNGLILMAEAGLNDPRSVRNLPSSARESYLQFLKTVEVSKVDRGENNAVRLMCEVTPGIFQAASSSGFTLPPSGQDSQSKQSRGKTVDK